MNLVHRRRVRRGFTLIELLLVVGILVMLVAFALPTFMGTQKQAQIDMADAQIKSLEKNLQLYQSQTGMFPTTDQGLKALVEKPEEEPVPKRWVQVLDDANVLDPWGNPYQYVYPGDNNGDKKPDIWSFGPDSEDGTDDDVVNWSKDGDSKDMDNSGDRAERGRRKSSSSSPRGAKTSREPNGESRVTPPKPRE